MQTPPLAPPKGRFTTAHFKVIKADKASTSEIFTCSLYLVPPFTGNKCNLCFFIIK